MGRVGMSREDFERCTPLEFTKIVQASNEKTEIAIKAGWEQTRAQVISVANLFSKTAIDPKKAWPFPWEKEEENAPKVPKGTSSYERMKEIEARVNKNHSTWDGSPS